MVNMNRKAKFNVLVDPELANAFREATEAHLGRLGLCQAAAMLAFLEMPVEEQAALVRRVYEAATQEQMAALVKSARDEQRRRAKAKG